jgi:hypothetical protein
MNSNPIPLGALVLLLQHSLSGCSRSGQRAADLLAHLAEDDQYDATTRELCGRMSDRLTQG